MVRNEGDVEWDRKTRAVGRAVFHIWCAYDRVAEGAPRITRVKFILDADGGTSVLGVLQGCEGGKGMVAFVGGPDLCGAVLAAGKKVIAGTLKWRADRPPPE